MVRRAYILLFLCALLLPTTAFAQIKVTLQAPQQVVEGHSFRVSYVVNSQDVKDYSVGDFTGFDVAYGPATSRSFSQSIINGKSKSSSSLTFSYTLSATNPGTFTLPAMTVTVDGHKYKSNTAQVKVVKDVDTPATSSAPTHQRTQRVGEKVTDNDLFVTVTASKKTIYEQEAVLLTYKLYTLVTLESCETKLPEMDEFFSQEVPLPKQKSLSYEAHNDRLYGTVTWCQYVVYPQKSGKITIPALPFDVVVVQQDRSSDPLDVFFGGGVSEVRVKKRVTAPAVVLNVLPLPETQKSYTGAVGSGFSVKASLSPRKVDANDAVQMSLVVSGTGNLKLLSAPEVKWPADFEHYDAKQTDNHRPTTAGATGSVTFNYTAVPRHGGTYQIPPVEFTYFDVQKKSYQTVKTDSFSLVVKGAAGSNRPKYSGQEDVEVLNSDIRHIMTGGTGTSQRGVRFFGSLAYLLVYPIALLLFVFVVLMVRRHAAASTDVAHNRHKRAGKVASKRLKVARELQKKNQREAFYEEVMRALWGYVADKLGLPVSDLSKDNVSLMLAQHGVDRNAIEAFASVLEECEFARFAQGAASTTMEQVMEQAADVIDKIEEKL